MKKTLLVIAVLMLSACSATVKKWELDAAEKVCRNNGGVYSINVGDGLVPYANCMNGAMFDISRKDRMQ